MGANQEIIAELRRVLNERDEAREQLYLTKAELGRWVDRETKAARERDEARAELRALRKDYDSVLEANVSLLDGAPYVDARVAFRRGAEAMREACAQWVGDYCSSARARAIRALPIPEDKP